MRNLESQYNNVLVQAIMCCSFSVIQGARVEISTDAGNFTPLLCIYSYTYSTADNEHCVSKVAFKQYEENCEFIV
jgi:hypothetical protein